MAQEPRTGLVLSLTASFMPGARVALASFLKTNPWFDGTVLILTPESALDPQPLRALWPKLRVELPTHRFSALAARASPQAERQLVNLQKGEALRHGDFDRLIFIDADMIFQRSVEGALLEGSVAAPPDHAWMRGVPRSALDYRMSNAARDGALRFSFCCGFMVVNRPALGPDCYETFVDHMARMIGGDLPDGVSEQAIFNIMYQAEVTPLGPSYNFLVRAPGAMPLVLDDAHIIHFSAIAKPWDLKGAMAAEQRGGAVAAAYARWRAQWVTLTRGVIA